MQPNILNRFKKSIGLFFILLIPACGPALISPHGRVLKDGQPVEVPKGAQLMVTFWPFGEDGNLAADMFPAAVHQKETYFECRGRKLKGIPPGKYRISVKLAVGVGSDKWNGAMDNNNSPFDFDLTDDEEEIILEIGEHLP